MKRATSAAWIVAFGSFFLLGCCSLGFLAVAEWKRSAITGWSAMAAACLSVLLGEIEERLRERPS